jgi:hypothetical protein
MADDVGAQRFYVDSVSSRKPVKVRLDGLPWNGLGRRGRGRDSALAMVWRRSRRTELCYPGDSVEQVIAMSGQTRDSNPAVSIDLKTCGCIDRARY